MIGLKALLVIDYICISGNFVCDEYLKNMKGRIHDRTF